MTGGKKRIAQILAAALCFGAAGARATDSLTMADFGHSIKLQVSGYTGSAPLANFPVLVRVSESGIPGFHFADMSAKNVNGKALGRDLAFFAEDGTRLELEKDTWDINKTVGITGEQLVWVKLPSMTQGTKFYMCYNVADGVMVTNDTNPWSEYVGVWHLNETNNASAYGTYPNSTATAGIDGQKACRSIANESGVIGKSVRIAKNESNWKNSAGKIVYGGVFVPDGGDNGPLDLGSSFTISGWFKYASNKIYRYDKVFFKRSFANNASGQMGSFAIQMNRGTNVASPNDVCVYGTGNDSTSLAELNGIVFNNWAYLTFAYNGTTGKCTVYTNGLICTNVSFTAISNNNQPLCFGNNVAGIDDGVGENAWNGWIDEVRLSAGPANADWVRAEYDTVANPDFLTLAPPDPPVVAWANAEGATLGVTSIGVDTVAVSGTVQSCDDFDTCEIQFKFWSMAESEPENWTTITNGLVASDAFSVIVPGMAALTTYGYKLRAVGDDGETASAVVSSSFTMLGGFSVAWSDAVPGAEGFSTVGHNSVTVGGTVAALGGATACAIECKVWSTAGSEPAGWTTLTNGLAASDAFSVVIPGLSPLTTYNYSLRAVGNDVPPSETTPVTGTFTTAAGLTIAWSSATSATGLSQVSYDFVRVGGTISALGGATSCSVLYKVWDSEGSEPGGWTTLADNLALNASFNVAIPGLAAGTAYNYKLKAVGDDEEETAVVTGSFTTQGETGEVIGSDYTHFFDDGTNTFWVANNFERYLQFTVTGYTGSEVLTNFPVLVDVRKNDTNGFTYDDFYHYDGSDLAFVDDKGHVIPHEIDTWNKGGQSFFWVRLPEMTNGTTFTMCYRSPLVDPLPYVGNTFERYVGVWHMSEKGNGVAELADATTNNLVGETHARSLAEGNGRIGRARRVAQEPGASSTFGNIVVFDKNDILRTGVGNVFTYSCWSKLVDDNPGWAYLVSRKADDNSAGWGIQYHDKKDSAKKLRVYSGANGKNNSDFFSIEKSGYSHKSWACWTFVFDGTGPFEPGTNGLFHAYYNGNELPSTVGGLPLRYPVVNDENATFDHLVIGGQQNGTGALNGYVDECRYSKGIRSADWIKAEYESTRNPQQNTFVTKGTSVGRGVESLVPVVVWEKGADLPDTVIDVSYAYVQFAGTVTFCGAGADECRVEYLMWPDGGNVPEEWTPLLEHATAGTAFSIPVTGLKQDMPYNFRIRAVCEVDGQRRQNRERAGSFRTTGNVSETVQGELLRVDNKFCHLFRAGSYTFTTPDYVTNVEIMVVGGGGAGGYKVGGGGGGGGLYYSQSFPVETNTTYRVQVGQGGNAASSLSARSGNGENSYFARLDIDGNNETNETMLILVPGGGSGGSYVNNNSIAIGAEGASGGGGTYGKAGGAGDGVFGHDGGAGNDKTAASGMSKTAAGGGGGAGRDGLPATADNWWAGGAGGVGVGCAMTGETLYYGAGGGGGSQYRAEGTSYTRSGGGGSGIGGNAANIREGTPATSGVDNTGAGGGGGSMTLGASGDEIYWQGGDGGDGVVLISYEVHGRDPISEEPQISMTRCSYDMDSGIADIDYRAFWAGVQAETSDIYILYSTVSSNDVVNGEGSWTKVGTGVIGTGNVKFIPPEVGHTYWVRLVARKTANSFMYSDEVASFQIPAVTLDGATWTESKSSPTLDYATVSYKLYVTNETAHLCCYWSESRSDLEGDDLPSGDGVGFYFVGVNMSTNTSFKLPAENGLARNKTYYLRVAASDAQGLRHFFSDEIVSLDTAETPVTVLNGATWSNNVATVTYSAVVGKLDPSEVELVALCSLVNDNLKPTSKYRPETNETVRVVSLGFCSDIALDAALSPSAMFPLWSETATNSYVRLALSTNVVVEAGGVVTTNRFAISGSFSSAIKEVAVPAIVPRTLIYIVTANAKTTCYGDEPLALDYVLEYAGQNAYKEDDWGWTNRYDLTGAMACYQSTNPTPVSISSGSPSGTYPIEQGTLMLESGGQERTHIVDDVEEKYQYLLTFSGATYTITNAVFSMEIDDFTTNYTGSACGTSGLVVNTNGVRNSQVVSCQYRIASGEWTNELPEFESVGNYIVQFKASAPNHDDVHGIFRVIVNPAPLYAEISVNNPTLSYTGDPQIPAITTNVTGLVRSDLNPLTCEFRDGAGEWQSEVPSFTEPGEYKLYFRVSAPNHEAFTTNCTFTIRGWDFMINLDEQTGYPTPMHMGLPKWLIDNNLSNLNSDDLADNATRYAALDATCGNGLKLWQNYVLERKDFGKQVVATIMQRGSRVNANSFVIHFPDIEPLMGTGLKVQYRLDRKLKGESEWTLGEVTGKYETNIPLSKDGEDYDPTGLYKFNLLFSPTNCSLTGQSVISSVATVGVMRVSCALTNMIAAVPWTSMSVDSAELVAMPATEVVNHNGAASGDLVLAYRAATTNFNAWTCGVDGSWGEVQDEAVNGVPVATAASASLARGGAFWLVRGEPTSGTGATNYVYLVGRYTGDNYVTELAGGTAADPGVTMCSNPTTADVALDSLEFVGGTPAAGDRIVVQNEAGLQTMYFRDSGNTAWGRNVPTTVNGRTKQVWTPGGTIPSGTGFWYLRSADSALSISFGGER